MFRRLLTAATVTACVAAMPALALAQTQPAQPPAAAPAKPPAAAAVPAKPSSTAAARAKHHVYRWSHRYRYEYYGLFGYSQPYEPNYRPYYPPSDVRRRGGPGPRVGDGTGLGIGSER